MHQVVTLSLEGPYDLSLSLRAAASFSPKDVRNVDLSVFRSAVRINRTPLLLEVRQVKRIPPLLEASGPDSGNGMDIKATAEWMLSADLDLRPFYRIMAKHPKLGSLVKQLRGLKPIRPPSLFEMAIIAIIEQQISLAAAYRMRSRLIERYGDQVDGLWAFPEPETLAQASKGEMMACGLSGRKSEYIRDLATTVAEGSLDLTALKGMSDEEARDLIMSQRGLGSWSADYILIRGLGRPNSVPAEDLGVRSILGEYLGDGSRMAPEEVMKAVEPISPYRGVAVFYLMVHKRLRGGPTLRSPGKVRTLT